MRAIALMAAAAAVTLLGLAGPPATAHEREAAQSPCFSIPVVHRKNDAQRQWFEIANLSGWHTVQWFILAADPRGKLDANLSVLHSAGELRAGRSDRVSNAQLQVKDVRASEVEGAHVCFVAWRPGNDWFETEGVAALVHARELRKTGSSWTGFDLPLESEEIYILTPPSVAASKSATAHASHHASLVTQMRRRAGE